MKKLLFIVSILLLCTSCSDSIEHESISVPATATISPSQVETGFDFGLPLFIDSSIWNTRIPDNVAIDENSDIMIEQLQRDIDMGADIVLSVDQWSCTVFTADSTTTRYDVALSNNWGMGYEYIVDVPIPDNAIPDPEHDGHMAIIDQSTGYVYEFWQFDINDGDYSATWGNRIHIDSDGIYPYGMSSRGSGFCVLAGMIWPQELEQGYIEHALILSIPSTKSQGPVYPATESDGYSYKKGAIPIGARLYLEPSLDLDSYSLSEYERIICQCLQTYGAIVGDTSSSVELEAINSLSYEDDEYSGMFDAQWIFLSGIPIDKLHVLSLGEQNRKPHLEVVDESIYR